MRMAIFPKWYVYNKEEPQTGLYPFACTRAGGCSRSSSASGGEAGGWDFESFDPAFWQHFEGLVASLRAEDVVADLILFHPYDGGAWGFDCLGGRDPAAYDVANDARFLQYAVARLAAFSNVWWSMANEWDLVECKRAGVGQENAKWVDHVTAEASPVWDKLFAVLLEEDPYGRERSIHNGKVLYNNSRWWVDHISLQGAQAKTPDLLQSIGKPVVWDEVKYEGDIPQTWGALSGPAMAEQFWYGLALGAHVGHSETILQPGVPDDEQVMWWSKGGELRGGSLARVAWLRAYLETAPAWASLKSRTVDQPSCDGIMLVLPGEYSLYHLRSKGKCSLMLPSLPPGSSFRVTRLNWWEMTTDVIANVSRQPVALNLNEYGVRLPANIELRRLPPGQAETYFPPTFVPESREAALRCYAERYPDLLDGYCDGAWERCDLDGLGSHYDHAGPQEGRELGCDTGSIS